jgi:hypothetical protein
MYSMIEYVPAGVFVLVMTVRIEVPWLDGVIEIEEGDHDELAPEILMLACGGLTVPENPLTLVPVSENWAEVPPATLWPEPPMVTV